MFIDIEKTDLAYAAGVMDSDGCISVHRTHNKKTGTFTYIVTACVAMKSDDVPQWFLATFGGRVRIIRPNGKWSESGMSGMTFFPPTPRWEEYGKKAADILEAILPYLKLKRARAEAAIRLARMAKPRGAPRRHRVTAEEGVDREALAMFVRSENQKGNARVAMTAKWGVN